MRWMGIPALAGSLALLGCAEAQVQKQADPVKQQVQAVQAAAADPLSYPLVLPDIESQLDLGILNSSFGPNQSSPALANKCYYYGDGGDLLSISDELLAIYQGRGFTLRTLCLGIISGIRYHPETGARLPTVLMADMEALTSPDYIGEPGALSAELTIGLPDCFRRGLPLNDCKWTYDIFNGSPLSAEFKGQIAKANAQVMQTGRALLAQGLYARQCPNNEIPTDPDGDESCYAEVAPTSEPYIQGYLLREYWAEAKHPELLPYGGFVDFSPVHAEGFAYAMFADGAAGPSASLDSAEVAVRAKNRASRARLAALKIEIGKKN